MGALGVGFCVCCLLSVDGLVQVLDPEPTPHSRGNAQELTVVQRVQSATGRKLDWQLEA